MYKPIALVPCFDFLTIVEIIRSNLLSVNVVIYALNGVELNEA